MTATSSYQAQIVEDISACVSKMGCQPILFVGSGLSRRYFSGPSWDELLTVLAKKCPLIDKEYAYYKLTLKDAIQVGEAFASKYLEWAWSTGKKQFPDDMFNSNASEHSYIKYTISQYLESITPASLSDINDKNIQSEIAALQSIKPHAIITTNYDKLMELIFSEYEPIIGQSIIRSTQILLGEIFKIHGCISDYNSLVITQKDYVDFMKKKKYLSAKLLTYFAEHPLLFIGYSASDPNIRAILSDYERYYLI